MKSFSILTSLAVISFALACNNKKNASAENSRTTFFEASGMDSTVKPGDNFYEFANGKWIKNTQIPADQSGWGSFYTLADENVKNLHTILKEVSASSHSTGSLEQKVGDYYLSAMDTVAVEKLGSNPLKPELAKIDAIKDAKDLANYTAQINAIGETSLIGMYVGADEKNSTTNIASFYQTGTTLPEKDYYTRTDSASKAARAALEKYAYKLFTLSGSDSTTAKTQAATIINVETIIAQSHRTPVEQRDPQRNYNKMALADLEKQQPNLQWQNYFAALNIKVDSVNIAQPGYYVALNKLYTTLPIESWKTKLKFEYLANNVNIVSKTFGDAAFEFNKIFSGQAEDIARWKKVVNRVDGGLPDLLGQLYVKKYFNEEAKKRMDELVTNLQIAFEKRIKNLDWMSDSTKDKANLKLNAFLKKIGYPTKWKNYEGVVIDKNDLFKNAKSVKLYNHKQELSKIGKPVDKTEWGMSAPTVNAYYNPTFNEIVFPAGILRFPFFDVNADDAINYGGIGMVIGHEMTHGFDDQGSQYDAEGNMKNWWNKVDDEKFKAKTNAVVQQYNGFKMFETLHVNGELTLGENLADIGGLAIAYDAFKMTKQGKDTTKIDGFTPDQRFFLGFAQVWRIKDKEESMRTRLNTDPHSPETYRVNGPTANFTPFYAAWNVKETDKMFIKEADRAKIW
jgi:putative endopeptidase